MTMPTIPKNALSGIVNLVPRAESVFEPPLSKSQFTLDSSGVAGFFGGESAVRAMATVNLVPQRRWCGWYNAPGSYDVARQYGPLAMSGLFDGLFPGGQRDPAKILMIDGQVGPKCIPVHSPTADLSRIGHLGYLLERKTRQIPIKEEFPNVPVVRRTMTARVTLVRLRHMPEEFERLSLIPSSSITFALGTMLVSVGAWVTCALVADWFCFASIALGIIANGVACSVIGSGTLILKHKISAQVDNPGDLVLKSDSDIVVLVGNEGAVSPFARARFILQYDGQPPVHPLQMQLGDKNATSGGKSFSDKNLEKCTSCDKAMAKCTACGQPIQNAPHRRRWAAWFTHDRLIGIAVFLLLTQFLAQLLLIPQGTLFRQLMFIATLIPSWMYHSYLSSLSLDFQTRTLFKKLRLEEDEDFHRYQLNTWTEAVVFTCLAIVSVHPMKDVKKIEGFLDGLLPNKTDVWKTWKRALAARLSSYRPCPSGDNKPFMFPDDGWNVDGKLIEGADLKQLKTYFDDAERALKAWNTIHENPEIQNFRRG